ncbi:MFS transporter [Vibrio sp. CAU 1672]|uniref:MFS transporter n=1 Tax=Vibrio sp. CAU 1672 TaxID=3032594 RepID=UPI0023D98FB0|nr:MFS transporter [Vibrio sp. CAU 1672]MDF2153828.1 MFS transporter [Vibrio sp. CAU 1672]
MTHYSRLTLTVCLCSIVTFSNIYWLQPLLPLLQQSFGVSSMSANLAMSAPLFGMGLGLLVYASWSDAVGRCTILIVGTAVGLCISFVLPLVEDYSLFLALRFVQGSFLATCPAVAIPLLGDELRKSWLPAAVGFYIASNTIGGISCRLLGGISSEYLGGWQAAGHVIAAISAVLFLVVYLILPQQRRFKPTRFALMPSLQAFASHLKRPQLVVIYLIIGLAFGCFVNLSNYLMIVLEQAPYALPSDVRSLLFLTLLGGTTSSSLAGKFSKKYSQATGVAIGIGVMLFASFVLGNGHLAMLVVGMVLMAVGFFFCHAQASALVGRSVNKAKGSAQALYSLFYYTGASVGVFFFEPPFQQWGWQGVLLSSRIALAICLVLVLVYQALAVKGSKTVPQTV